VVPTVERLKGSHSSTQTSPVGSCCAPFIKKERNAPIRHRFNASLTKISCARARDTTGTRVPWSTSRLCFLASRRLLHVRPDTFSQHLRLQPAWQSTVSISNPHAGHASDRHAKSTRHASSSTSLPPSHAQAHAGHADTVTSRVHVDCTEAQRSVQLLRMGTLATFAAPPPSHSTGETTVAPFHSPNSLALRSHTSGRATHRAATASRASMAPPKGPEWTGEKVRKSFIDFFVNEHKV
jgi:hypothetical protein